MKREDKNYLQELLESSGVATLPEVLRKLAYDMVSETQFNTSLQHKFETDHFKSSEVISKIISLWISYRGKQATLINFEQILRNHDLNAEAGKYLRIL